jgi:mycolipenoyl-CoA---2-(long-chain-fatty acyl)-trehalose mycolipenoyltransferase / long-chain-acyl-CoA---trehalose acyltransferase
MNGVGCMVALGTIHDWAPTPGAVVTWEASPGARAKAENAPISDVPVSFQQSQHLRGFAAHAAKGRDMARLCIGAWDISGICDIPVMTEAITTHLRRHDTYHSWFEYENADNIVRRTIRDPSDIALDVTEHGHVSLPELRANILATTDLMEWGCFSFGIIQRADHFTFYMSIDHLLTDGMSTGVIFVEIHMAYAALVDGAGPLPLPDPGSYDQYCVRQRRHAAELTQNSPQVRGWMEFAGRNGGTLPDFPLPLGDPSVPNTGAMIVLPLMDAEQTQRFESNCAEAGARFSGGVFACAALAEHELTGAQTYHGITPYDTRSTPDEYMTPGWFASFIPVTVEVAGREFGDVARAAQDSFDSSKVLGDVPFDRVLELAPAELGLRNPERDVPLLSYIDVRSIPLSSQWEELNVGIYGDSRLSDQVCVWVNRFETETTLTVSFPENPVARDSVSRYVNAVQSAYRRAADFAVTATP